MNPIHVSDPVAPTRHKSQGSRVVSFPIVAILIASVAGFPPIAGRLLALDSLLHAHNDKIVSLILIAAPFALIGIAITGLLMVFRFKRSIVAPKLEHY